MENFETYHGRLEQEIVVNPRLGEMLEQFAQALLRLTPDLELPNEKTPEIGPKPPPVDDVPGHPTTPRRRPPRGPSHHWRKPGHKRPQKKDRIPLPEL